MKKASSASVGTEVPGSAEDETSHLPPVAVSTVVHRAATTTILAISATLVVASFVELLLEYRLFPTLQVVGVVISGGLIAAALAVHTNPVAPKLAILALAVMVASVITTATNSPARTSASIVVFLAAYFSVVALTPRHAAGSIAGLCVLWIVVVSPNRLPFEAWGHEFNIRWMTLAQLVVSATWLWRVWYPELTTIAETDSRERETYGGLVSSLLAQERLKAWRESVVRTHETTLNDIRYVLSADQVDGKRLRDMLVRRPAEDRPATVERPMREVIASAVAAESGMAVTVDCERVRIDPTLAETIRVVTLELLRNARRHGRASSANVAAWTRNGHAYIQVAHDGAAALAETPAGIGAEITLKDTIDAAGGHLRVVGRTATVTVPLVNGRATSVESPDLETPRLVLSVVMAGNAVGGLAYVSLLALVGSPAERLGAVIAALAFLAATRVVAARSYANDAQIASVALAAAAVPVLVSAQSDCHRLGLSSLVCALTLYAMAAVLLWAKHLSRWTLGLGGLLTMAWFAARQPPECITATEPALIGALAAPALLPIAFWTSRMTFERARRRRALALSDAAAAAKAAAGRDSAARLHASTAAATQTMLRIAALGTVSDDDRQQLRCLDSSIRASMQVDPQTSGGFAVAAEQLVQEASAAGIATRVLTLRDSGDSQPLPPEIVNAARVLLLADTDGVPTLQVLTAPREDTMLVTTSVSALANSGLDCKWVLECHGCIAEVECDRESDVAVLIVRRESHTSAQRVLHPLPNSEG